MAEVFENYTPHESLPPDHKVFENPLQHPSNNMNHILGDRLFEDCAVAHESTSPDHSTFQNPYQQSSDNMQHMLLNHIFEDSETNSGATHNPNPSSSNIQKRKRSRPNPDKVK